METENVYKRSGKSGRDLATRKLDLENGKKYCHCCDRLKNIDQFRKDSHKPDKLTTQCAKCRQKRRKKWYRNNKKHFFSYMKEWRKENKDWTRRWRSEYRKKRPEQRAANNVRKRLKAILKQKNIESQVKGVGCNVKELKQHLESHFKDGMTWENYGSDWHIHHIKPLHTFDLTKKSEQLAANHYSNLLAVTIEEHYLIHKNES